MSWRQYNTIIALFLYERRVFRTQVHNYIGEYSQHAAEVFVVEVWMMFLELS